MSVRAKASGCALLMTAIRYLTSEASAFTSAVANSLGHLTQNKRIEIEKQIVQSNCFFYVFDMLFGSNNCNNSAFCNSFYHILGLNIWLKFLKIFFGFIES